MTLDAITPELLRARLAGGGEIALFDVREAAGFQAGHPLLAVHAPLARLPGLAQALPEQNFQFEREGYFVPDSEDHTGEHPVFNLTIGLRDTWSKQEGAA